MDANSWRGRLISTSKRYQSSLQLRSDLYNGFEEIDVDEESRAEFPCPFCDEDFDIIGLCCHINDEHPVEAKNGECPVCGPRVGMMDMVGHITMQQEQYSKVQRKRRFHKGGTQSNLSLLRKELRDGNLQALFGGSNVVSSSNTKPDPMLSSFIYNLPMIDEVENVKPPSTSESGSVSKSSDANMLERNAQPAPLSDKDKEERTIRSEFAQALVLSTMFDDIL